MKKYDLLIVGSGAAGLRAAISAKKANNKISILLVTKKALGKAGVTCTASSARMSYHVTLDYTKPCGEDAWKYHAEDIYNTGMHVSDRSLAEILARNSADSFYKLVDEGVPFVMNGDKYDQFSTYGSSFPRACYTGPHTGRDIHRALMRKFLKQNIDLLEFTTVTELLTDDNGRISGAVIRNNIDDTFDGILCKACVIATGGGGGIYRDNVFPPDMNGEALALAYNAGAELVNMEFVQFGPASLRTKMGITGSFFRSIPRFVNDEGDEFLLNYAPKGTSIEQIYRMVFEKGISWSFTYEKPNKFIDVAIYKERLAGRKVYLDFSANPRDFHFSMLDNEARKKYFNEIQESDGNLRELSPLHRLREINPESIGSLLRMGVDLENGDKIEIAECAQFFLGGIHINKNGRSSIRNLFAAGECTGGTCGANRLGGNSLLDTQVFGDIAGANAAAEAARMHFRDEGWLPEAVAICRANYNANKDKITDAKNFVRVTMSSAFSVVRVKERMELALAELRSTRKVMSPLDSEGAAIFTLAEIMATACLMRKESRGCHLYYDHSDGEPLPLGDSAYERYIVHKRGEKGEIQSDWHNTR